MNKATWLLAGALVFWGCDSDNSTAASSSEPVLSSSTVESSGEVESSSSTEISSSSVAKFIVLCKENASVLDSLMNEFYRSNVVDYLIEKRISTLESAGLNPDSAALQARTEFYKELHLDRVEYEQLTIDEVVTSFFDEDELLEEKERMREDLSDGTLDSVGYCLYFSELRSGIENPYSKLTESCVTSEARIALVHTVLDTLRNKCPDSRITWTPEFPSEPYSNSDVEYGSFEDLRDGHVYRTIEFAGLTWMAENMVYTDSVVDYGSLCAADSCLIAGRYYNYGAAELLVCPEGWRLPKRSEFELLGKSPANYAAYFAMAEEKNNGIYSGSDESGLGLIRTGYITTDNVGIEPENSGYAAYLWMQQEDSVEIFELHSLDMKFESVNSYSYWENLYIPMRCVKE